MTLSIGWAIVLLLVGLAILVAELFVPSGGVLFITAILCILVSVVMAFAVHTLAGIAFLVVCIVLATILPGIGFRIWRRSPVGQRMFLDPPSEPEEEDGEERNSQPGRGLRYASLVGEVGRTLTPLRPAGMTDFHGQRIDTVSEGVMIDRGVFVRVIRVEGNRVVVRVLDPQELEHIDLEEM